MDCRQFLNHADAWEVTEAVDLLLGMVPLEPDDPDHKGDLCELAYRAIDAGTLPCIGKKKDRRVAPVEFAKWAASKGFEIPADWNPALLAHDGLRESDPATQGGGEASAGTHPGYGPWQSPRLPPDYWLRNPEIGPLPEWYERPRQCLIEEDDAISFSQVRAILEPRWNTTPTEIALWILGKHPGLHIFFGRHEIWEDWNNHEFSFLRCKPGLSGSTRPCSNLVERTFALLERESFANSFVDSLVNYRFSRSEVEDFDPANNEWNPAAPIEYIADEGRNRLNPSGRLLTYAKAVEFLSAYSYAPEDAAAAIKRDYERGGLIGLAPLGFVRQNMLGFDFDRALMTETWFLEGQIVGLAKAEFGAPVTRWDAASRPEVAEDVLFEVTFSLEETKIKLRERLNANDCEIKRWLLDGWIQAYRHHRFRDDNSCSKAEPFRYDDDGEPERQIFPLRRFLRDEVERFDPSTPSLDDIRPSDYPEFPIAGFMENNPRGEGYNPSGRWVSFRQALDFLGAVPGATVADVERLIRRGVETSEGGMIHIYGPDEYDPPLEEGYFYESQIVAIATVHFGRRFDGWDAITRPHPAAPLDDERLPILAVAAVGEPPKHLSPQQLREPAPAAAGTPGTQSDAPLSETERAQPKTKRTRITRLRAAAEAARTVLLKKLGREPSVDELFSYLADHDETGIIVDQRMDVLVWVDTKGNFQETGRKALGSMLGNIRAC